MSVAAQSWHPDFSPDTGGTVDVPLRIVMSIPQAVSPPFRRANRDPPGGEFAVLQKLYGKRSKATAILNALTLAISFLLPGAGNRITARHNPFDGGREKNTEHPPTLVTRCGSYRHNGIVLSYMLHQRSPVNLQPTIPLAYLHEQTHILLQSAYLFSSPHLGFMHECLASILIKDDEAKPLHCIE